MWPGPCSDGTSTPGTEETRGTGPACLCRGTARTGASSGGCRTVVEVCMPVRWPRVRAQVSRQCGGTTSCAWLCGGPTGPALTVVQLSWDPLFLLRVKTVCAPDSQTQLYPPGSIDRWGGGRLPFGVPPPSARQAHTLAHMCASVGESAHFSAAQRRLMRPCAVTSAPCGASGIWLSLLRSPCAAQTWGSFRRVLPCAHGVEELRRAMGVVWLDS